jgi:putative ABC transport system ATP-binding protein
LKHRPVQERSRDKDAAAARLREAARTGNSTLDIEADWIDYAAAGCGGAEDCDQRIVELLRVVDRE